MSPRLTLVVAIRVLRQLRRDPRTVAMILVLPTALMTLMWWTFGSARAQRFDHFAPQLLAFFPLLVMFLVASVTTLRERTGGTLERLLAMPLGKADFIGGYAVAFAVLALVQSGVAVGVSATALGLDVSGSQGVLVGTAVLDGILGAALGLLVSAFATSEFQAVQFFPALVLPQLLLCGLFVPRDQLPDLLHTVGDFLPLTYAVEAATRASAGGSGVVGDLLVVAGFAVAALAGGAVTLRRRTG